jgi:hypothetical protein
MGFNERDCPRRIQFIPLQQFFGFSPSWPFLSITLLAKEKEERK